MKSKLHTELQFPNGIISKNRFALAPMTNSQSHTNGVLSHSEFLWLKQFAQGGFGMVITCASHISLEGQGWPNQMGIFEDKFIPSLKALSGVFNAYGSLGIIQIYHGGLRSPEEILGHPPLDLNEMSQEKIKSIVEEYAVAAERSEMAGFAGVELHGANGYLITQFISQQSNKRCDAYGGSLKNRARFYLEVLQACRKRVSPSFIIGARLSPENFGIQSGLDLAENVQIAKWLAENGADYFHISTWDAMRFNLLSDFRSVLPQDYPLLIAGGLVSTQQCEEVLEAGASMVSLGKIAIGNPYFPIRSQNTNYKPNLPPYSESYLKNSFVSSQFYKILHKFSGFLD